VASLLIFHHNPRETVLHRLDPRFKILLPALSSPCIFAAEGVALGILAAGVFACLYAGRVPLVSVLKGALAFWIVLVLLFFSRASGTPGEALAQSGFFALLPLTREGLAAGLKDAGRLALCILLGHLLVSVTSTADIERAAAWFLGARAGLLIRLSFGMIPELLDEAEEILTALFSRGFSFRRRPLRGMTLFGNAFARKAAGRAARTAEALEARAWNPLRSWRPFSPGLRDAAAILVSLAVLGAALGVQFFAGSR
jgi:energy-coupling factor transporter transmembrane protein EcfT